MLDPLHAWLWDVMRLRQPLPDRGCRSQMLMPVGSKNSATAVLCQGTVMQSRRLLSSYLYVSTFCCFSMHVLRHPWTISIAVCGCRCGQVSLRVSVFNLQQTHAVLDVDTISDSGPCFARLPFRNGYFDLIIECIAETRMPQNSRCISPSSAQERLSGRTSLHEVSICRL